MSPLGPSRTWGALAIPPLAWYLDEQGWGQAVRLACASGGPPLGPMVGVAALLACAGAAILAWPAARRSVAEPGDQARSFLAWLAVGLAGAFALAIVFQTLATVITPPCAR